MVSFSGVIVEMGVLLGLEFVLAVPDFVKNRSNLVLFSVVTNLLDEQTYLQIVIECTKNKTQN